METIRKRLKDIIENSTACTITAEVFGIDSAADECEFIVEDVAIQFKEFVCELNNFEYQRRFWNKTDEEIFEIFKQEKGL